MSELELVIPEALGGERIDRAIATLSALSRSVVSEAISSGQVKLNSKELTQRSVKVKAGDKIVFPVIEQQGQSKPTADKSIEFEVLYEDDDLLIVNKPVDLVIHPGSGRPDKTLVNGLLARYPEIADVGEPMRPGIVHRLDQQTSGALMVARSQRAYEVLVERLASREISRGYIAIVDGHVVDPKGIIDAPIGRSSHRRTKMAVSAEGKEARTHYFVLDRSDVEAPTTALRAELETGRTHQIRVHLAAIGHPVLGDPLYAGAAPQRRFSRVGLHAARLALQHPISGEHMVFNAAIPADMADLARRLDLDLDSGDSQSDPTN